MPLIIDGAAQAIDTDLASLQTRLDALQREQRYIKTVLVNGDNVLLNDLYKGDFDTEATIEIQTYASLDDLIEDTMESASEYIPKLIGAVENSIRALGAFQNVEGLDWFQRSVSLLNWHLAVLRNFDALASDKDTTVCKLYQKTDAAYVLVKEAIANQDFIALHDVLIYEMYPLLTAWNQCIEVFQSQMRLEHAKEQLNLR